MSAPFAPALFENAVPAFQFHDANVIVFLFTSLPVPTVKPSLSNEVIPCATVCSAALSFEPIHLLAPLNESFKL